MKLVIYDQNNIKMGLVLLALYDEKDKPILLEYADFTGKKDEIKLGQIYRAKVKNKAEHIGACYVDMLPGVTGFLPKYENVIFCNSKKNSELHNEDEVLVQIKKIHSDHKKYEVSEKLSIPGDYLVIHTGKGTGFSKNISPEIKNAILEAGVFDDMKYGFIVRTSVEDLFADGDQAVQALKEEAGSLSEKLDTMINNSKSRSCYSLMFEPLNEIFALIRKYSVNRGSSYTSEFKVITDNKSCYEDIEAFSKENADLSFELSLYEDKLLSLQALMGLKSLMSELESKKVYLKCGGYLFIEQTQAMVVVDVNSGKIDTRKEKEDAILQVNLEACDKLMEQLILRNLSGMIIVDFINMKNKESVHTILERMRALARKDNVKTSIIGFTKLGLLEMTREKKKPTLFQQMK